MARVEIVTRPRNRGRPPASAEMIVAVCVGVVAAVPAGFATSPERGTLIGWDIATLIYLTWVWLSVGREDAARTQQLALAEDPNRTVADVLILLAALASLIAVGLVLARSGGQQGADLFGNVGLALVSIVLSWALVHTLYTLRYARLYYYGEDGGIDFGDAGPPDYMDFAYLAFTIGMTYQVSDTQLETKEIRRTALRQALLSYVFGTGILATAINLVASLSSR